MSTLDEVMIAAMTSVVGWRGSANDTAFAYWAGGGSGGGFAQGDPNWKQEVIGGKLITSKLINTKWVQISSSDQNGTTVATSVQTGVGSFHLGDYHSIGSGGQNVLFINHDSDVAFYPGTWQGESIDGTTTIDPVSRALESSRVIAYPNGVGRTGNPVPYQVSLTPSSNLAFYSVRVRLEEDMPNGFSWIATSASGKEFMRKYDATPKTANNYITIQFEYPIYLRVGDVANIKLIHGMDGDVIKCTAGTTVPTEPWRETRSRRFIDVPLDKNSQSITIPAGSDNATYFPLARPESRKLRISGKTPSVASKSIFVYAGNTLYGAYTLISEVLSDTVNENFSIDVEVPLSFKYIYFKKGFTDTVNPITIGLEPV